MRNPRNVWLPKCRQLCWIWTIHWTLDDYAFEGNVAPWPKMIIDVPRLDRGGTIKTELTIFAVRLRQKPLLASTCETVGRQESPTNILISPSCFIRAGTFSILRYRTKLLTLTFPKKDILNHSCYARYFTFNATAFPFQLKNCTFCEGNYTSFLLDTQSWFWDWEGLKYNVVSLLTKYYLGEQGLKF